MIVWDVFRLRRHVDASLGRLPDRSWSRRPGRPRISQVVRSVISGQIIPRNTLDLWRSAIRRGHRDGAMRRPSPAT